ncbi:MAG: uL13 family ribosomal protein, partial [Candidatus Marinimicrobia bacterium]|nr:uL13 family ribosomal protein [Candidatus Neomarinimicrobiota bacterium]
MFDTYFPKKDEIEKKWYVVDASDKVLGRIASEIAKVLRG